MYKDDIWHRKLVQAVNEHRHDFSEKQTRKYQIELMLRIAQRVKDSSDGCEICRSFQHTLTRLEEEFQELPGSKAQRRYQVEQLREMAEHFVKAHRLAPSAYYTRQFIRYGLIGGLLIGIVLGFLVLGNGIYLPLAVIAGLVLGWVSGTAEDARVKNEHRLI
jgi:hypothetical protein